MQKPLPEASKNDQDKINNWCDQIFREKAEAIKGFAPKNYKGRLDRFFKSKIDIVRKNEYLSHKSEMFWDTNPYELRFNFFMVIKWLYKEK